MDEGVTRLDRIRNYRIRGTTKVGEIYKKVPESRLKCCGHVLRRDCIECNHDGKNWKRVSGILCDRRLVLRVKTVVRPAMMCGAGTWAVNKAQEIKLNVAEMRMLRWMRESPGWTELGIIELEGQLRWEKYTRKCRKVG